MNLSQIAHIEDVVDRAGIFYSHLRDDLIDHICCDVEQEIEKGLSFKEAFERVREKFGIQTLKNIQQDTLYLTDLKYRNMKKSSKILGNVALALIAIAALFKIMHWPGAGPLLILGFFVLITFFYPTAIFINYKETKASKSKRFIHISALIGGVAFMTGVLFKIMHWPSASILLEVGWLTISLIFLPVLLFSKRSQSKTSREKRLFTFGIIAVAVYDLATLFKVMHFPGAGALFILGSVFLLVFFITIVASGMFKDEKYVTGKFIFLITTSLYFILFSTLLALNVSKDVLSTFARNTTQTVKINNYLETKTAYYFDQIQNENSLVFAKQVKSSGDEAILAIKQAEQEIIMRCDKVDSVTAQKRMDNVHNIIAKDNYDYVTHTMLILGKANEIKKEIEELREVLSVNDQIDFTNAIKLLETPYRENADYRCSSWDSLYFYHATLISAMSTLSQFEKNIRQVQLDVYRELYYDDLMVMRQEVDADSLIQELN